MTYRQALECNGSGNLISSEVIPTFRVASATISYLRPIYPRVAASRRQKTAASRRLGKGVSGGSFVEKPCPHPPARGLIKGASSLVEIGAGMRFRLRSPC